MCFISRNRLILIIALLSIVMGMLTFATSVLVVHYSDELDLVTVHIKFLIACTFCTIGAGIVQAVSSVLYVGRRLITRHWIQTNAIVFGVFLLGICIAMVRFQSTLPEGFDPKVVVNRTETIDKLHQILSIWKGNKSTQSNTSSIVFPEVKVKSEDVSDELDETTSIPLESSLELEINKSESIDDVQLNLEELVARKTILLKFYFGIMMLDFLALPLFLGLVSSKASKYDLKGNSYIQSW